MCKIKIGEMAEMSSIPAATLRYYDKKGILIPEYTDEATGYRYYSVKQLTQLSIIYFLRALGFRNAEIQSLIVEDDVDSIRQALLMRRTEIDSQIKSLGKQKSEISHSLEGYELLENHPVCGTFFLQPIPERHLFYHDVDDRYEELGYSQSYEHSLAQMIREMKSIGIYSPTYINMGSVIARENVAKGIIEPTQVYAMVNSDFCDVPGVTKTPAKVYLCNICEEPENERYYLYQLYEECVKRGLKAGDYYREEIIFYPRLQAGKRNGLYLQAIPVAL